MNEKGHYFIKNKDYNKFAFEYYLITQVNSELQTESILQQTQDAITDLETLMVYANSANQQRKEFPAVFKDFEKWTFPNGLRVIQQHDQRFQMLEDFYRDPATKLGSHIHEINYFVVTDIETLEKYYCTSAYFYEKVVVVDKNQEAHQFFMPRCHVIMSSVSLYYAQKNLIGYLLHVHRIRQNSEQDKIIQITKGGRIYGIEQSKLFDYYIQFTYENCLFKEENEKVLLKFHTNDKQLVYFTKNDISNTLYSIVNPSNAFFDSLIFGQSPFNLLQLITFITLEYQLIFLSKRTNSLPLFAENLLELIKPLFWRGIYIPNLMDPTSFNYQTSKLPYIIGLNKKDYQPVFTLDFATTLRHLYSFYLQASPQNKRMTHLVAAAPTAVPTGEQSTMSMRMSSSSYLQEWRESRIFQTFYFPTRIQDGPKYSQPQAYKNYFMSKINLIIGDIKFYEEDYYSQAVLRYKQFFYNFMLLTLHDIIGYFSKSHSQPGLIPSTGGETPSHKDTNNNNNNYSNKEVQAMTTASSNYFMRSLNQIDQVVISSNISNSFQQVSLKPSNPATAAAQAMGIKKEVIQDHAMNNPHQKKIVYFNYQSFIASYDEQDQPFYSLASKTLILNALIKDCFRATDYRDEFIEQSRQKQHEYSFGTIFCFVNDAKFLLARNSQDPEITISDRMKELEDVQHKLIAEQLSATFQKETVINADDGVAEYLECYYNNGRKESYERTQSSAYSSYLSSFMNNPNDIQKELIRTPSSQFSKTRRIFNSTFNLNTQEMFKEDTHPIFVSKEQFNKQFSEDRRKRSDQQLDNLAYINGEIASRSHTHSRSNSHTMGHNRTNGVATQYTKHFSEFNEELWQIPTQPCEDIQVDPNRQALISDSNTLTIRQLALFDKKDLLSRYQKQDEDELMHGRYLKGYDGLSTVIEVQSAYSAQPPKNSRRNSLKEFLQNGTVNANELNIHSIPGFSKQGSSLYAPTEDLLSANGDH